MIDSRASTWTTSGGDVAILRRTGGLTRAVARSAAAITTYRGVGDCRPSAERRYLSPAVVHCATFGHISVDVLKDDSYTGRGRWRHRRGTGVCDAAAEQKFNTDWSGENADFTSCNFAAA